MEKKLERIRVLFKICFSVGIYILTYLFIISLLSGFRIFREMHTMYLNATAMGIAAVVIFFTIKKDEFTFRIEKNPVLQMIAVILLSYSASAFFNIVLGMIPWQNLFESNVIPDEAVYYGIPLYARMICYEVVAPIAEELLFRQVIYKRVNNIAPVWVAVVSSALLFGLYHGSLVQGIYAFIMGILLALVYEWTGSFIAPVIFHMVANHVSDICYEFESVGKVVYSVPGAFVWAVLMITSSIILIKKQNKCSKKALHSS